STKAPAAQASTGAGPGAGGIAALPAGAQTGAAGHIAGGTPPTLGAALGAMSAGDTGPRGPTGPAADPLGPLVQPPSAADAQYVMEANQVFDTTDEFSILADLVSDPSDAPLTAVLVQNAAHGTLTLNADGTFVYTPTTGFVGSDSFQYAAFDGQVYS